MENSESEVEAQKSFHSPPPRRRRSTFFEKRESVVLQPATENIDPNMCNKENEVDEKHNQKLNRYYGLLLAEKNKWKEEVKSRQNKYHDLRQQFHIASKSKRSRILYSMLSNEEIEFFNRKINISRLVEYQENLHKSMMLTRELYRRAVELDNVFLNHCEERLRQFTDYILQNSTVEFVE